MTPRLLLVTFPVDGGNSTFEVRFVKALERRLDLVVHRFAPIAHPRPSYGKTAYLALIARRMGGGVGLHRAVSRARKEGRRILFQGISPALFALPACRRSDTCLVTDWTRKLYEPLCGSRLSSPLVTIIHRQVLASQKYVFGLTQAVVDEIHEDYGIPAPRIKKVRLPLSFDLETFEPSPRCADGRMRLLFVGNDLRRKGGDALLSWFRRRALPDVDLTMVTNDPVDACPRVTVRRGIRYATPEHVAIYRAHDVLVLPTRMDSYPSVLAEAACAGLAIVTTDRALGAPDIVAEGLNGFVCRSEDTFFAALDSLLTNQRRVENMKAMSRQLMQENFSDEVVLPEYLRFLFE